MKRFYLYIVASLLTFSMTVHAQSPCDKVSVEAFQLLPQSGPHNYFGVRVSISEPYWENIVVTGYIWDGPEEHGYDENHPYTLTIYAGYTTAETASNFYETGPAAEGAASISSVSPCPLDPLTVCNNAGQLHNDYQSYVLSYLISQNTDLSDTAALKTILYSKTTDFFEMHEIESDYPYTFNFGATTTSSFNHTSTDYSSEALEILDDLETLIGSYDPEDDEDFFNSLNTLKASALSLTDPVEVFNVGVPVTIAIYSFTYWKATADSIAEIFWEQDSIRSLAYNKSQFDETLVLNSNPRKGIHGLLAALQVKDNSARKFFEWAERKRQFKAKCHIGLGQLGASDAVGAVYGAVYGGIGAGPLGAVAGGLMVGSMSSINNIAGQLMGCLFSWW